MRHIRISVIALAVAATCGAASTHAADFEVADGKLEVKGSLYYGTVTRTHDRDDSILPSGNAGVAGLVGSALGGKNQDDGNLNYAKGDTVSRALKGNLQLKYTRGDYGAVAGLNGWQDYALMNDNRPWGNTVNGYAAGQPLSDSGFASGAKFSGLEIDNLYWFGKTQLQSTTLDWKLGQQRLEWGTRFTVPGGLGELTPRNAPAARRAGALPDEGLLPVPAATGKLTLSEKTSMEGLLQVGFRPTVAPGCGTFYSTVDFVSPGCNLVMLGGKALSDPNSLSSGNVVKRAADKDTSSLGAFGVALKHKFDNADLEMGAYLAQYESRTPYFSAIKTRNVGAPFVPGSANNPQYFIEYPDDIRVLGVTLEKKRPGGLMLAELTYRPNQPFQYNAVDLLNALASAAGATPLRSAVNATPAGGIFTGYERHQAVQLNLGVQQGIPGVLGAKALVLGGEMVLKYVPDLPDPLSTRFRRADVYGQAPVNGGPCPATSTAAACSLDGYVSRSAWAYRLRVGLNYPQIMDGVDFSPTLTYGQDVKGWSEDGSISEGRNIANLSLKATIKKSFVAELSWQPTWGGNYNNANDRSTVALSVGYQF